MAESTALTTGQSFSLYGASSAISAYGGYRSARHDAKMADISWRYDKGMAEAMQKVNDWISSKNRAKLLTADAGASLEIQVKEMEARASAMVAQSAEGMQGGSAQQVLHAIARSAEKMQSDREVELDAALFDNTAQGLQSRLSTQTRVGIQPIDSTSGALFVGQAAASISAKYQDLYAPIKTE